jgi:hypothetical protein
MAPQQLYEPENDMSPARGDRTVTTGNTVYLVAGFLACALS